MNKMVVKGRERLIRGKLINFTDLPIEKQEIFKKIKKSINEVINVDVYIFGSYNHGYWDEESDYDVMIFSKDYVDLSDKVRTEVGVKTDILFNENNLDYVMIP
jgi:predicted nucleotidyltransferase